MKQRATRPTSPKTWPRTGLSACAFSGSAPALWSGYSSSLAARLSGTASQLLLVFVDFNVVGAAGQLLLRVAPHLQRLLEERRLDSQAARELGGDADVFCHESEL